MYRVGRHKVGPVYAISFGSILKFALSDVVANLARLYLKRLRRSTASNPPASVWLPRGCRVPLLIASTAHQKTKEEAQTRYRTVWQRRSNTKSRKADTLTQS